MIVPLLRFILFVTKNYIRIKMRPYLPAFLLIFFLLIDKSLSARVPPSLTKVIFKQVRGANKNVWKNALDKSKQKSSPTTKPNAPTTQIIGLSLIKEYFSNFGYLQSSAPFDDYLDQETMSAITTYQQFFNLQATGYLNDETAQQMLLPRCAVPDININYNLAGDGMSWPKAGNQWFPAGSNLTYGFAPKNKILPIVTEVLRDAFARWAEVTAVLNLNLTETSYDEADIKVGFYIFDDKVVIGASIIRLQVGSNVTTGEIHLDTNEDWALPNENERLSWENGVFDLESVVMHQIGHLLGLDHSNEEDSVMYPSVLPTQLRKVELSDSDKDNFLQQFNHGNSGYGGGWGVLLFTTLSLGFAYVVFCY